MDIYYDVSASTPVTVTVAISTNSGVSYNLPRAEPERRSGRRDQFRNRQARGVERRGGSGGAVFPERQVRMIAGRCRRAFRHGAHPRREFYDGQLHGPKRGRFLTNCRCTPFIVSAFYMDKYDVAKYALWTAFISGRRITATASTIIFRGVLARQGE